MLLVIFLAAIAAAVYGGYLTLSVNVTAGEFKWARVFGDKPVARKPRAKKAPVVVTE